MNDIIIIHDEYVVYELPRAIVLPLVVLTLAAVGLFVWLCARFIVWILKKNDR